MKDHTVIFNIGFKGHEVAKKLRVKVPAEDEVQAYDKAMKYAESNVKVSVISIDDTNFPDDEGVIEEPVKNEEEKSHIQQQAEMYNNMANMESLIDQMNGFNSESITPENAKEMIPKLRALGKGLISMCDFIDKEI